VPRAVGTPPSTATPRAAGAAVAAATPERETVEIPRGSPTDTAVSLALASLEHIVSSKLGAMLTELAFGTLFSGLDHGRSELRRRCLRDRICEKAREKYLPAFKADAEVWAAHLQTDAGRARMERFAVRKVQEVLERWTAMQGSA